MAAELSVAASKYTLTMVGVADDTKQSAERVSAESVHELERFKLQADGQTQLWEEKVANRERTIADRESTIADRESTIASHLRIIEAKDAEILALRKALTKTLPSDMASLLSGRSLRLMCMVHKVT